MSNSGLALSDSEMFAIAEVAAKETAEALSGIIPSTNGASDIARERDCWEKALDNANKVVARYVGRHKGNTHDVEVLRDMGAQIGKARATLAALAS